MKPSSMLPPSISDEEFLEIPLTATPRQILEASTSLRPAAPPPGALSLSKKPSMFPASPLVIPSVRPSLRPSMIALLRHSLLAPPPARPMARGLGTVAAVATGAFVGTADGLFASRAAERLHGVGALSVVAHCAAVMMVAGLTLGLLTEVLLASAVRLVPLVRLWRWLGGGPRRWFAHDLGGAHRVLLALIGAAAAIAPVFPVSRFVVSHFHSKALMAMAITITCVAAVTAAAVVVVLAAPPTRWVLERAHRVASPGAVVSGAAFGLAAVGARLAMSENDSWFTHLDWTPFALGLSLPAAIVASILTLYASRKNAAAPISLRWPALMAALAMLGAGLSGRTLGERQVVANAVTMQSSLASWVVRALQRVTDLDSDGSSALFNGGDCDDSDPTRHPTAHDIPGNGIDENCSLSDARPPRALGDGAFAADTGLPAGRRPSFLLVTIDTLRPDHLGAYGYHRPTSPNIDAFARTAARFEHAYTTTPRTLRSLSTIWTGRFGSQVVWGSDPVAPAFEESNVTLAEILRDAGYVTAAFNDTDYFLHTDGFFQGFAQHHDGETFKGDLGRAVAEVSDWIRARDDDEAPFFGWLHLIDAHDVYRDLTEPRDFGHDTVDRYDEEIARADAALQRVFEATRAFSAAHPDRPLVVIVTADHGEGLKGRAGRTHGADLHEDAIRVPLFVSAPGVAPGPRAPLVSLIDLHNTVLNYAGLRPNLPTVGRSMVRVLRDPSTRFMGPGTREHLFAEAVPDEFFSTERRVLYAPPYKLLWDVGGSAWELYDLSNDPTEALNLYDERPAVAAALREELSAWVGANRRTAPARTWVPSAHTNPYEVH